MQNKKNIYVLGTCRSHDMARQASNGSNKFFYLNRGDVFLHTTKEILNIVDYQTRKKIPKEYRKYMTIRTDLLPKLSEADLFLVEISSNRCVKYDDHYFKFVNNNVPNKFENIYKISPKEIRADLRLISRRLKKPIVFMAHFNVLDDKGKPIIKQRQFISDIVHDFAKTEGHYFFDPVKFVGDDWTKCIDEPIYHYTDFGRKKVGRHFSRFLERRFDEER